MWRLPLPALLLCCSALAAPTAAAADAARGATLYAPCAACHGAQALGNPALQAPALAGQDAGYLARQLRNFRAGTRGATDGDTAGATMRSQIAPLPDDAAIDDVAAWLASLPAPRAAAVDGALLRNGSNYYQSKCGACHGARAEGNPALFAPRLAGLDAGYLARQYRNFAAGLRGTDPADRYGRQMRLMATALPAETDLRDVLGFIASQSQQE